MIDARTMVSLLVRNYEVPSACGVTLASSRTLGAIYRHAVLKESNPLQSERNFDAQLVREKAHHQEEFARNASGQSPRQCPAQTFYRACSAGSGWRLPQATRGRTLPRRGPLPASALSAPFPFNVTAERFRREPRQKILIAARWQNRVRIGATRQKRAKKEESFPATAYARSGTSLPSGVGGAECLLSSNWGTRAHAPRHQGALKSAPGAASPLGHCGPILHNRSDDLRIATIQRQAQQITAILAARLREDSSSGRATPQRLRDCHAWRRPLAA